MPMTPDQIAVTDPTLDEIFAEGGRTSPSAVAESETGFAGARGRLLTLKRMVCLADRAAENPAWWRVQKLHHYEPGLSAGEIAELLNMPRKKVIRLLADVPIGEDDFATLPDYTTLRELERKKEERR